ncbi:MAG: nucleotidyltransferase domain-containing protein [Sulfuricella sp.]|nr:nucleotidyltransferase domain-containing protein [Sulfuricella sp.]
MAPSVVARIQEVLARFPAVDRAVLYGSRAMGTHKTGSDIDLTLYGDRLAVPQLAAIASELDDLLLPYTIDLSLFAMLNNADLREHIGRVGKTFYERSTE